MKELTIKSAPGSLTLVPAGYPLGKQPTGAINYKITDIPDDVPATKVVSVASTCFLPTNRFEVSWGEIKNGGAIIKNNNRQIGDRPKTPYTFRLDPDLLERLRERAQECDRPMTHLLEEAIRDFLETKQ